MAFINAAHLFKSSLYSICLLIRLFELYQSAPFVPMPNWDIPNHTFAA